MASEEELLVTREEYDKVRQEFIKEAKDRRRLLLVKQGGDETWVRGLTDDEVIHHGLVLKKVIKAMLEFKWAEAVKPAVEKESGSDMAAFVQMMKMQMEQSMAELKAREAELKAREAKEEREYKAREARDALALEQAKADAKARDARDEQARAEAKALLLQLQADNAKVIEQMKVDRELAIELANKEAEAREKRLIENKEAEKSAQLELLKKMDSQRRGETERAKVAQRQKDDALDSRIKKYGDI